MLIQRRKLLKLLRFAPLLPLGATGFQQLFAETTNSAKSNGVHILLHGLFFLEVQGNNLIVASPSYSDHRYFYLDHNNPTPHCISDSIDLTGLLMGGGTPSDDPFPWEMLKFSKNSIKSGSPFIPKPSATAKYGCFMTLPYPNPKHVVSLRVGNFENFHPDLSLPDHAVGSSILDLSGPRVGLVTWLYYEPKGAGPGFRTRMYYAEHCDDPQLGAVNDALAKARNVFPKFDLQIKMLDGLKISRDDQQHLPSDINPDDEASLAEMKPCPCPPNVAKIKVQAKRAVEVATCPQFGVVS